MNQKIIFIDNSESFIVRSVEKSLEDAGFECMNLPWDVNVLSDNRSELGDIIIAYIDDLDDIDSKAFIFLRDVCVEDSHGFYLMGHKDDIDEVISNYHVTNVADVFYRPINAVEVAEKISETMSFSPMKHKSHILVVDDSGTMLNTIQEWLGEKYRVSVVNSAMNAITFLGKGIPDLILLDYEMPGCSGPQLLEMLRADTRTENIPVIFLTAKDDQNSVKKVLALKPEGYLLKTMPKDYIIGQVYNFFEKKKTI